MTAETINKEDEELLTVDYVAQRCNVSDKTIRRWMRGGDVAFVLVGPTKRIRITRKELKRLLSGNE